MLYTEIAMRHKIRIPIAQAVATYFPPLLAVAPIRLFSEYNGQNVQPFVPQLGHLLCDAPGRTAAFSLNYAISEFALGKEAGSSAFDSL